MQGLGVLREKEVRVQRCYSDNGRLEKGCALVSYCLC